MYSIAKPHILIFFNAMCLLSSACSLYFHLSCKERTHCSLGGKGGDYIAAMFLKFKVLLEDRGIISVETYCTLYDMI